MAVKTKQEIMTALQSRVSTSDEDLAFIADVTDTLDSMEKNSDEEWKTKYEENDKMWRQKYHDRFFNSDNSGNDPDPAPDESADKQLTFESLFKQEG